MAEHDGNSYDAYTAERARLLKVFGRTCAACASGGNSRRKGSRKSPTSTATRSAFLSGGSASRAFSRC